MCIYSCVYACNYFSNFILIPAARVFCRVKHLLGPLPHLTLGLQCFAHLFVRLLLRLTLPPLRRFLKCLIFGALKLKSAPQVYAPRCPAPPPGNLFNLTCLAGLTDFKGVTNNQGLTHSAAAPFLGKICFYRGESPSRSPIPEKNIDFKSQMPQRCLHVHVPGS